MTVKEAIEKLQGRPRSFRRIVSRQLSPTQAGTATRRERSFEQLRYGACPRRKRSRSHGPPGGGRRIVRQARSPACRFLSWTNLAAAPKGVAAFFSFLDQPMADEIFGSAAAWGQWQKVSLATRARNKSSLELFYANGISRDRIYSRARHRAPRLEMDRDDRRSQDIRAGQHPRRGHRRRREGHRPSDCT
jgi:hypothetical protein